MENLKQKAVQDLICDCKKTKNKKTTVHKVLKKTLNILSYIIIDFCFCTEP